MRRARFLCEQHPSKALSSAIVALMARKTTTGSSLSSSSVQGCFSCRTIGGGTSRRRRRRRPFPLLHPRHYNTSSTLLCCDKPKQDVCVQDIVSLKAIQAFNRQNDKDKHVTIGTDADKGWALYAKQDIQKGQTVFGARALQTYHDHDVQSETASDSITSTGTATGPAATARGSHTIQTGWTTHVLMDLPAILVNHSCHANIGILRENDRGAYDFVALRDIPQGEQVLWDYETSEYDIFHHDGGGGDGSDTDNNNNNDDGGNDTEEGFQCSCGASNCRGILKGYRVHGPAVVELYGKDHIAPYLLRGGDGE